MLANYLGKMALVDDCVERLADAMKARGTWDNTLVIFTSDHGEMMGSHGYLTKGRFYEESVRVPLFVRWPGHVKTGRSKAPVQMMDVYPTIVEAVGGELTPGRFAKSLLPIATGKAESIRPIAISEIGDKAPLRMMARDDRFKYWADEEREYHLDLVTSAPTVVYQVGLTKGGSALVDNPSKLPAANEVTEIREPIITANILVPPEYVGAVLQLCSEKRGVQ